MATLTQYSEFETLLDEIAPGETISREQACRLIRCPAELLPDSLRAARAERARHKPAVITYSRKVFLPLTNLCADYCGYCAFRRDPREEGAHTMTPDEILALVAQAERLGCTEALFSLGDKPEARFPEMKDILRRLGYKSTLHYLEAMCELVLRHSRLLPHANPGLMSASWINRLAAVSPSLGLMLETTSRGLLEAGGAHEHAPDKIPARRLQVLNEAGKQQVPFTTGILIGIGETLDDRVDALFAIRDMHQQYGVIHLQQLHDQWEHGRRRRVQSSRRRGLHYEFGQDHHQQLHADRQCDDRHRRWRWRRPLPRQLQHDWHHDHHQFDHRQ